MSSSKVLSRFSLAPTKVPVGTEDFVVRYRRQIEEGSELGRKMKAMEQQHQIDVKEAYERGRKEGEAVASKAAQQKLQQFDARFKETIQELVVYRDTLYTRAKQELFDLAFRIADAITSSRGESEQQQVLDTINCCLSDILDKSKLRIRVNATQVDYVRSHLEELCNHGTINSVVTVEADARVNPGGCIIETDSGSADATIESQLAELKRQLLKLDS